MKQEKKTIKKLINYIGNAITVVALIFLLFSITKLDINFSEICSVKALFVYGLLASIILAINVYLMAFAWNINLSYLSDQKVNYLKSARVYSKANIGKYIPGNVMHFVERNLFLKCQSLSQMDIAVSTIIEIAGQVFVAIIISVVLSFNELKSVITNYISKEYLIVVILLTVVLLIVLVLLYKKNDKIQLVIKRLLNKKFLLVLLKVFIIYGVVFILNGFLMVGVFRFILCTELSIQQIMMIVSFFILAWLIGFVVPGAPGGLGVREAVILFLLGGVLKRDIVLLAAMIYRLMSILGDVLAYLISMVPMKKNET